MKAEPYEPPGIEFAILALCGHRFAVPASRVSCVLDGRELIEVAGLPRELLGLAPYAQALVPVIDLSRRLELGAPRAERTLLILLDSGGDRLPLIGLRAEACDYGSVGAAAPLPRLARPRALCVQRIAPWQGSFALMLQPELLLEPHERAELALALSQPDLVRRAESTLRTRKGAQLAH